MQTLTIIFSKRWRLYSMKIEKNPNSAEGNIEVLTEISINETLPTYNWTKLSIPPRT